MPHLVIVGCPPSSLQLIEWACRRDLVLTVLDRDLDAPMRPLVADYRQLDHADVGQVVAAVREVDRDRAVDGIIPGTDLSVVACAVAAATLGLPGVGIEAAIATHRKSLQRARFMAAGVPGPRWRAPRLADRAGLGAAAEAVGYPLVVKPNDLYAGLGVRMVRDPEELLPAADEVKRLSRDPLCLLEEYLEGPDLSVEALHSGGELAACAITDDLTTGPPYFVQVGHSIPSRLPAAVQRDVQAVARAAHRALGVTCGVSQTEVKVTRDGCRVMEVGVRLGGDKIKRMVESALGLDLFAGMVDIALGREPDVCRREPPGGAANRFFLIEPGRLEAIRGLEEARRSPGVEMVTLYASTYQEQPRIGQVLRPFRSLFDRVGFVLATADSAEEAVRRAESARDRVVFVTTPVGDRPCPDS